MDKAERRAQRRELAAKAELKHGLARRAAGKSISPLQERLIAEEEANHGRDKRADRSPSPKEESPPAPTASSSRQWGDYEVLGQDNFDD